MDSAGEKLERLARLRASGDLTDEEFEVLKARLIDSASTASIASEEAPVSPAEEVEEEEEEEEEVVAYEMTGWTSDDQGTFSEILTELSVWHEFDEEGDLVVSPPDEETVNQAMDEFSDTADERADPDETEKRPIPRPGRWADSADRADDAASASSHTAGPNLSTTGWARRLPALRLGSWVLLSFNALMGLLVASAFVATATEACEGLTGDDLELCQGATLIGASIGISLVLIIWAVVDVILITVWIATRSEPPKVPGTIRRVLGLGLFLATLALGISAVVEANATEPSAETRWSPISKATTTTKAPTTTPVPRSISEVLSATTTRAPTTTSRNTSRLSDVELVDFGWLSRAASEPSRWRIYIPLVVRGSTVPVDSTPPIRFHVKISEGKSVLYEENLDLLDTALTTPVWATGGETGRGYVVQIPTREIIEPSKSSQLAIDIDVEAPVGSLVGRFHFANEYIRSSTKGTNIWLPAWKNASTTATDAPTTAPKSTISQGFGSQDASADMVDLDCGEEDILGFRYPAVTVKNNSSKPSSYWIKIVAESKDGAVRYDDSFVIINSLNPGQTTTEEGLPFTDDLPRGSVCKITEVSRTAS